VTGQSSSLKEDDSKDISIDLRVYNEKRQKKYFLIAAGITVFLDILIFIVSFLCIRTDKDACQKNVFNFGFFQPNDLFNTIPFFDFLWQSSFIILLVMIFADTRAKFIAMSEESFR